MSINGPLTINLSFWEVKTVAGDESSTARWISGARKTGGRRESLLPGEVMIVDVIGGVGEEAGKVKKLRAQWIWNPWRGAHRFG